MGSTLLFRHWCQLLLLGALDLLVNNARRRFGLGRYHDTDLGTSITHCSRYPPSHPLFPYSADTLFFRSNRRFEKVE